MDFIFINIQFFFVCFMDTFCIQRSHVEMLPQHFPVDWSRICTLPTGPTISSWKPFLRIVRLTRGGSCNMESTDSMNIANSWVKETEMQRAEYSRYPERHVDIRLGDGLLDTVWDWSPTIFFSWGSVSYTHFLMTNSPLA